MNTIKIVKGTIIAIAVAALLGAFVPVSAFAQGPGLPMPGMSGNGFLPFPPLPNLNDPGTTNLVGSFLGSFLGTMIINNQYQDRYRHDYDGYRGYDYRPYGPYDRGYYDGPYRGWDRGYR